jgi:hypothetical protein
MVKSGGVRVSLRLPGDDLYGNRLEVALGPNDALDLAVSVTQTVLTIRSEHIAAGSTPFISPLRPAIRIERESGRQEPPVVSWGGEEEEREADELGDEGGQE